MRVVLHPEARNELRAAAVWHDERRAGLGEEFLAEATRLLTAVGDRPQAWPRWPGTSADEPTIRRTVMSRFPYLAACEIHEDHVLVLAFAHAKRRPLYWLGRAAAR